jgi:hypothetical protein
MGQGFLVSIKYANALGARPLVAWTPFNTFLTTIDPDAKFLPWIPTVPKVRTRGESWEGFAE